MGDKGPYFSGPGRVSGPLRTHRQRPSPHYIHTAGPLCLSTLPHHPLSSLLTKPKTLATAGSGGFLREKQKGRRLGFFSSLYSLVGWATEACSLGLEPPWWWWVGEEFIAIVGGGHGYKFGSAYGATEPDA